MKKEISEIIKILDCFESKKAKFYWLSRMKISDSVKGYIIHFLQLV